MVSHFLLDIIILMLIHIQHIYNLNLYILIYNRHRILHHRRAFNLLDPVQMLGVMKLYLIMRGTTNNVMPFWLFV